MSRFFQILVAIAVLAYYADDVSAGWAKCWRGRRGKISEFGCFGVSKLTDLDKAPQNVKSIVYHTSELTNIRANAFYRFQGSLESLDMHKAGIHTIEPKAFNGLVNLRNLTLWGNNLTWVQAAWFEKLNQLRNLDLSFNAISYIEEAAFLKMGKLENFYIDYNLMVNLNWNVFSYLGNLKRVRLGKNPWDWWFRAAITRQLDDQHVNYDSEWDNFDWINHVIWNCVEVHQARNDDDSVLDCASAYLLQERSKVADQTQRNTVCSLETAELYNCASRYDPVQNLTITPQMAVRKMFQGFIGSFKSLQNPDATLQWMYP
ncbi:insulin-like growth factor-binding protein complex acid labile subunit [Athalia rosae]|uniref:insulin-like growth factor-binding protein complex acid labile subunit n=1 Tax=Athalia rosae TaxID=37344 RepID=UPI0020345080|nr:insulin-like growth factor-binding protein complex acid labile subunit [Athalia rosae]